MTLAHEITVLLIVQPAHSTAMAAEIQLKLKNAESSIVFMQEQHAKTLEGLHQEIQKLQQKNASEIHWWGWKDVLKYAIIDQIRDNVILCMFPIQHTQYVVPDQLSQVPSPEECGEGPGNNVRLTSMVATAYW